MSNLTVLPDGLGDYHNAPLCVGCGACCMHMTLPPPSGCVLAVRAWLRYLLGGSCINRFGGCREMTSTYSFRLWPSESQPGLLRVCFDQFGRVEIDCLTDKRFGEIQQELRQAGFVLLDVVRVPDEME